MAPTRPPPAEPDAPRKRNQELSLTTKSRLYERARAGQTGSEIARAEGLPKTTVTSILRKARTRQSLENKKRPGKPREYSARDARRIVAAARKHPEWTYMQLREHMGVSWKRDTLRTMLREAGFGDWGLKKRPVLTEQHER